MSGEEYEVTDVSQDEFEDLVLNSTTKRLREELQYLKKVKGTKWEQKYIKHELAIRRLEAA
jgi:hypothetical protein